MDRMSLRTFGTLESYSRRNFLGLAASGSLAILLPGCGTLDRGSPVPRAATMKATVLGLPNERFFPMLDTDPLEAEFGAAVQRFRKAHGMSPTAPMPQVQLLAVSGGGENGAFGAGLLCGWSEHGYAGGITIVKDYVLSRRLRHREVFVPLRHDPDHAQVDFGIRQTEEMPRPSWPTTTRRARLSGCCQSRSR